MLNMNLCVVYMSSHDAKMNSVHIHNCCLRGWVNVRRIKCLYCEMNNFRIVSNISSKCAIYDIEISSEWFSGK